MTADPAPLHPIGNDHAIEVMAFGIEWDAEFDAQALQLCDAVYAGDSEIRAQLPIRQDMQGFKLEVRHEPGDEKHVDFQHGEMNGIEFRAAPSETGSIPWAITIHQNMLVATCRSYTRWADISRRGMSLMEPFLQALTGAGKRVGVVGLQYHDVWVCDAKPENTAYSSLFRDDSQRVPRAILSSADLWHLHQGWFEAGYEDRRNLHSVNIDVVDAPDGRRVNVVGMHKSFALARDGVTHHAFPSIDFAAHLDSLHEVNRSVLCDLLTDSMLNKIGLRKSK